MCSSKIYIVGFGGGARRAEGAMGIVQQQKNKGDPFEVALAISIKLNSLEAAE